jgi:hypothetical protein
MVRKQEPVPVKDRFTSLQPTYEDSIAPDPGQDWEDDE